MVKKGFSLVEALVVMTILAVFFAFGARVMTQKPKLKKQNNEHGFYECYYKGGQFWQHVVLENVPTTPQVVPQCTFDIETKAAFYSINMVSNAYKTKSGSYDVKILTPDMLQANTKMAEKFDIYAKQKKLSYDSKTYTTTRELFVREVASGGGTYYFYNMSEVKIVQSCHKSFEPNVNDVLIFHMPTTFKITGQKFSFVLDQNEEADQFKTYVKNTYPNANIYDKNSGNLYAGVLLIW